MRIYDGMLKQQNNGNTKLTPVSSFLINCAHITSSSLSILFSFIFLLPYSKERLHCTEHNDSSKIVVKNWHYSGGTKKTFGNEWLKQQQSVEE